MSPSHLPPSFLVEHLAPRGLAGRALDSKSGSGSGNPDHGREQLLSVALAVAAVSSMHNNTDSVSVGFRLLACCALMLGNVLVLCLTYMDNSVNVAAQKCIYWCVYRRQREFPKRTSENFWPQTSPSHHLQGQSIYSSFAPPRPLFSAASMLALSLLTSP